MKKPTTVTGLRNIAPMILQLSKDLIEQTADVIQRRMQGGRVLKQRTAHFCEEGELMDYRTVREYF